MFSVGLTGGIGSGKSIVADFFKKLGVTIIDADDIAHQITKPNRYAFEIIVEHFGKHILLPDGNLNRKALREIVFNNSAERKWLENLLHPVIREAMKEQLAQAHSVYAVLVIPLLAESQQKNFEYLDRICVINVSESIQIQRVMQRDHISKNEVKKILATQCSNEQRLQIGDDVIYNDDDLMHLKNQVLELNQRYLALAEKK